MKNTIKTSSYSSLKKQQGWTMWSLMLSIGIGMFFAYIAMQLVPVYNQNRSVKNAMSIAFERADNVRSLNRSKYVELVQKQLFLDEAHRDIPFKDLIKFRRDKGSAIAELSYSKVVPLFFNISLKVDFEESVIQSLR